MTKKNELPYLTIARYFAAMWVVWFHFGRLIPMGEFGKNITASGYIGVPFFFILSGFILTYASRDLSLRDFYARRIARIYPVYLLAWALFGAWFIASRIDASLSFILKTLTVFGGLSLVLAQAWIPGAGQYWNPPAWSLSCEAFFYLCFPFLCVMLSRWKVRTLLLSLGVLFIANAGFVAVIHFKSPLLSGTPFATTLGDYLRLLPPLQMLTFLVGAVIGRLYVMGYRARSPWIWTQLAVLVIAACVPESTVVIRDALIAPLFAWMILSLASVEARSNRIIKTGVLLGNASYAIYILQTPLWDLFCMAKRIEPWGQERSYGEVIVFCIGITALCCVVYVAFEKPVERWLRGRLTSAKTPAAGVSQSVVA